MPPRPTTASEVGDLPGLTGSLPPFVLRNGVARGRGQRLSPGPDPGPSMIGTTKLRAGGVGGASSSSDDDLEEDDEDEDGGQGRG